MNPLYGLLVGIHEDTIEVHVTCENDEKKGIHHIFSHSEILIRENHRIVLKDNPTPLAVKECPCMSIGLVEIEKEDSAPTLSQAA